MSWLRVKKSWMCFVFRDPEAGEVEELDIDESEEEELAEIIHKTEER